MTIVLLVWWLKIDNSDEQAAQVRRELDGRLNSAEEMARVCSRYRDLSLVIF